MAVALLTVFVAREVQPLYRVSASLSIDEPVDEMRLDEVGLARYAHERIAARHASVLQRLDIEEFLSGSTSLAGAGADVGLPARASALRDGISFGVTDVSQKDGFANDPGRVSATFSVVVENSDRRVATLALEALLKLYAEIGIDTEMSRLGQELATLRDVAEQSGLDVQRVERTLAEFRQENSSILNDGSAADSRSVTLAESELAQLEQQIQNLQARGTTVDRTLQELDPRGVLLREVNEPGLATAERLTALQTIHAMLRGRYGAGNSDVQRFEADTRAVKIELERQADLAVQELRAADAEYERLQDLYPLDFPDVVRFANTVSGLERAVENINAVGLSAGEIRNIENIAGEEQDIQAQLIDLRLVRDGKRTQAADTRNRAARAPLLEEQRQAFKDELDDAEASRAAALEELAALESEHGIFEQRNAPAQLLSAPPYVPQPMAATRVDTIVAAGVLLGLLCMGIVVIVVERLDRRVLGARSIALLHGVLPMAEIPILPQRRLSSPS